MEATEGMCPNCKATWSIRALMKAEYQCPRCGHQLKQDSVVPVKSAKGKVLTPCTLDRARKEVAAGRARWDRQGNLWLNDAPENNALYRRIVFKRDHGTCLWCGDEANTVDHVVPYSDGGPYHPENLFCACESCNQKRQNEDAYTFLELLAGEGIPSPYAGYVVQRYRLATAFVQRRRALLAARDKGRSRSEPRVFPVLSAQDVGGEG
ncbi:HNH endonuclease [Alicyclobacillus fastidiosus]|uniref:HNH endonuclease n=1 Tax=Alicyclobacillus fastidiosus TaxID=392011 RepID=A0ABY6ZBJ0_9BACL|nr:HNH endonuclease [Alicyclobacillus fastidiosus]WAH40227.1 HNH endonuclease [Alicyclobacillus fastidiosus]GMA61588.1 hypothetical protein GCM10025859_20280 [Alicyclobacillus fastidiosus]